MDPVTQGLLGAAAAQGSIGRRLGKRTWLYGALGGMAADLDVLIRSSSDPMVAWEFHRHFTHALAFVPVGGLLVALPFMMGAPQRQWWILAATTIGYATHGLLDAFTSYGTLWLWPFSNTRIAWSWISIIDPIYTLILGIAVVLAARRNQARWAQVGLFLSSLFLGLGAIQHHRARTAVLGLAGERGDAVERVDMLPSLATNRTWRGLYRSAGLIHVAEIQTPWFSSTRSRLAGVVPAVTESTLPAHVQQDSAALDAFRTFYWFAGGWVAYHPEKPQVLGDLRYSADPAGLIPLWGIELRAGERPPVRRVSLGPDTRRFLRETWRRWTGAEPVAPSESPTRASSSPDTR